MGPTANTTDRKPNKGLAALLIDLWRHLSPRRQMQFAGLTFLMLVSAFAEIVSLGALIPFLGVLTSPEKVFGNPALAGAMGRFGISSTAGLLLPLTSGFVAAVIIAGAIRMLLLWVSTRLSFAIGADLSIEVYRRTLFQPYSVHVARNSSELISGVTTKVGAAINVLYQFVTLLSSAVLMAAITITLILVDPVIALAASVGFGVSYGLISWIFRRRLDANSDSIAREQTRVVKALQEGLGGIRDVLMDGTQGVYCEAYRRADVLLRKAQGDNHFIGGSPRFAMEALGMVLIAGLAYWLGTQPGGLTQAVPVLGALALGAQRMLPALQQGYSAWASILGSRASLADAIDLLDQPLPAELLEAVQPLPFSREIAFDAVRFRYTASGPWVLNGMTFKIRKGARVGFVGKTGSGKSTALDLLMGLLEPTSGQILVDGQPIAGSRVRAWQKTIAHVPQAIYLADTTIAENIALGVTRASIDHQRVRSAAQRAQIDTFIDSMPEGYQSRVGERGVRLSGGQRQRIGIARALYKEAAVLVFDEATSALDSVTEQAVVDAIEGLGSDLTILVIAHRLSTLESCDIVFSLDAGQVVSGGKSGRSAVDDKDLSRQAI